MPTDAAVSPSLANALESLRDRGLGLRRGSEAPMPERTRPSVPSGHPTLDAALGSGGWPRGALALLDAPVGCGATTLALGSLAAVQEQGGLTAWLDLDGTFDPAVAARLGVGLEWLLLVRPHDAGEAVELAAWLGRSTLIDALVLDLGERSVPDRRALDRLAALLARVGTTAALVLAPSGRTMVSGAAGVRVVLRRTAWLSVGRDLVGQRVDASVERHRWALAGGSAELDLWFGEGRRIDPLVAGMARPRLIEAARPALRVVGA
ncbi:MAG: DNA recombination/repair protein RecA [Chloroflexi bacterium]|nr:DNA recombination/repair protein RecA [Chloroflexota bacterium]